MLLPTDHQLVINGGKTRKGGASKEPKALKDEEVTKGTGSHEEINNNLNLFMKVGYYN